VGFHFELANPSSVWGRIKKENKSGEEQDHNQGRRRRGGRESLFLQVSVRLPESDQKVGGNTRSTCLTLTRKAKRGKREEPILLGNRSVDDNV